MSEKWVYFFVGLIGATILYAILVLGIIFVDTKLEDTKDTRKRKIGEYVCLENKDILSTFQDDIVLMDNRLYNLSFESKYSNEESCMNISNIVIDKVIDKYYVAEDEEIYTLQDGELVLMSIPSKIPTYLLEDGITYAYSYDSEEEYSYYVLKDGKIYDVTFERDFYFENGEGKYRYEVVKEDLYYELDEDIIYFKLVDGNIEFVKTKNHIYTNTLTNSECNDYLDVACVYELRENNIINLEEVKYVDYFADHIKYILNNNKVYRIGV